MTWAGLTAPLGRYNEHREIGSVGIVGQSWVVLSAPSSGGRGQSQHHSVGDRRRSISFRSDVRQHAGNRNAESFLHPRQPRRRGSSPLRPSQVLPAAGCGEDQRIHLGRLYAEDGVCGPWNALGVSSSRIFTADHNLPHKGYPAACVSGLSPSPSPAEQSAGPRGRLAPGAIVPPTVTGHTLERY